MKGVTYGPFPGGWPEDFSPDFRKIAKAGFTTLRLYDLPESSLLDAASAHGLSVFAGLEWGQSADFLSKPTIFSTAKIRLAEYLRTMGDHPALAGVYVGNEIPADLARWMGPVKTRAAIESLISTGREISPHLLFAYANYPSTEYLEPENADFSAFNVYLEKEQDFRSYITRLHHIAGDRPLVISEFGMDSQRNGTAAQAEAIRWALEASAELDTAGLTIYSWSDRWWNAGAEVLDWDFGLTNRKGEEKPAFAAASQQVPISPKSPEPFLISVIVCTRNGIQRIGACLTAIQQMTDPAFETIVVDDGSTDGTADLVAAHFPWVNLIRLNPGRGLSHARNTGAAAAKGKVIAFTDDDCEPDQEWISRLRPIYAKGIYASVGGPNLPPLPRTWEEAVIRSAPGAPSHVMLDDEEAEHLPGCNISVTAEAFYAIGGFDEQFHTAGDDVDFCWRLSDAGFRLGFAPGAFVWHWRRASVALFLKQQLGYGRAERMLLEKHPERFSAGGDAIWKGFVYGGGPVRVMEDSIIYHGPMGNAGYQTITNRMLPLRGLEKSFSSLKAKAALALIEYLQPRLRAWSRNRKLRLLPTCTKPQPQSASVDEFAINSPEGMDRTHYLRILLRQGWKPCDETLPWDVEKYGARVLMATERGDGIAKTTLVRVSGTSAKHVASLLQRPNIS